jgi:hypothetical protein
MLNQASEIRRTAISAIPTVQRNLPPTTYISTANISELIKRGSLAITLRNGTTARIIYKAAEGTGFYLGFALNDRVYARVAFDYQAQGGQRYMQGGYGMIRNHRLPNECAEIAGDQSTPILVSEVIKEGYKGIGSTLMNIALLIGRTQGMERGVILLSLQDGFYEKLGFVKVGNTAKYVLKLQNLPSDFILNITPREGISSNWRPIETVVKTILPILTKAEEQTSLVENLKDRINRIFLRISNLQSKLAA